MTDFFIWLIQWVPWSLGMYAIVKVLLGYLRRFARRRQIEKGYDL